MFAHLLINESFVIRNVQAADIERHRKRFESNCVVTKLKDSNNSAVIASGLCVFKAIHY